MMPRSFRVRMREAGVDADALAREVGVASLDARFTPRQADAFIDVLFAAVGDGAYGLRAGADIRPELFGVAGLAAMSAPTLGGALARLERYKRLFSVDTLEQVSGRESVRVRVNLARPEGPSARARADMELAFVVCFGRRLTMTRLVPLEVRLRGPAPAHSGDYEAVFGCAPRYGAEVDEVALSVLDMARPLVSSNPELQGLVGPWAEQLLRENGSEDVVARVRAALARMLPDGEPSLERVARALGSSERSLQRRLAEAEVSFRALLGEVRREVAREKLMDPDMDLAELSFLLGFSEPTAFHRAFRRWEGMTPREYREAARASGKVS